MTDIELVTSLEKSKELKEAGFPQDKSCFVWLNGKLPDTNYQWFICDRKNYLDYWAGSENLKAVLAAHTTDEILVELPKYIERKGKIFWLQSGLSNDEIIWRYRGTDYNLFDCYKENTWFSLPDLWLRLRKERVR